MTDDYKPKTESFEQIAERLIAKAKIYEPDEEVKRASAAIENAQWAEEFRRARTATMQCGKIPSRVVCAVVGDLRMTSALKHAEIFAESSTKSTLLLHGGVGAGKSTAAAWLAWHHGGDTPSWCRASELERRGRYDREFHAWLFTRSMLVLDDLGVEALDANGYFRSLVDELVDTYHGDELRFVITTNMRPRCAPGSDEPQFVERYGERVWSRIVESGVVGDCGCVDLRRGVMS